MTHFVKHEQCPKCALLGKDNGHNNLGIYSDGSCFCFSCGYTRSGSTIQKLKSSLHERVAPTERTYCLPGDVNPALPRKAREWLEQYSLTDLDIINNTILWSEHEQRVVFPIFGDNKELLAWQGRYLGTENKPKWFSQGNLNDILHVLGFGIRQTLVLVEDLISAIRLGSCGVHSLPLFGSHISKSRWLRIRQLDFPITIVWLDKDKQLDSIKFSKQGRELGMDVRSVITDLDPKCYPKEKIKIILTQTLCA